MENTSSIQYHLCDKKNCFFCYEMARRDMVLCPPAQTSINQKRKEQELMKLINVEPIPDINPYGDLTVGKS